MISIERYNKWIRNWIEKTKRELSTIETIPDIPTLKIALFTLIDRLNEFQEINTNVEYITSRIASALPEIFQFLEEDNDLVGNVVLDEEKIIALKNAADKSTRVTILFPELKTAYNLFQELCKKFETEFPKQYYNKVRNQINEDFRKQKKLLERLYDDIYNVSAQIVLSESSKTHKLRRASINHPYRLRRKNVNHAYLRAMPKEGFANLLCERLLLGLDCAEVLSNQKLGRINILNKLKYRLEKKQEKSQHSLILHNGEINLSMWEKEYNTIASEFRDIEAELNKLRNLINLGIEELHELFSYGIKIINIINNLTPGIPITIQRLAELLKINIDLHKDALEEALEYLLTVYPSIGKYDKTAQMFVVSEFNLRKIKEKVLKCPECGTELKNTDNVCPSCDKKFEICPICKRIIIDTDLAVTCHSCGQAFHKNHLEEWMNTNSNCPICKERL